VHQVMICPGFAVLGLGLLVSFILLAGISYNNEVASDGSNNNQDTERSVILACESYDEAEAWVAAIEDTVTCLQTGLTQAELLQSSASRQAHTPSLELRLATMDEWVRASHWKLFSIDNGIRILELDTDKMSNKPVGSSSLSSSSKESQLAPCLRVDIGVPVPAPDVLSALLALPPACRTGCIKELHILESVSPNCDIVHIVLEPIFTFPTWSAPRDFCLKRYWRDTADGGYIVCLDSITHHDCPLLVEHIRAELHAAYIISPSKVRAKFVDLLF
jgi:hypothetical protein